MMRDYAGVSIAPCNRCARPLWSDDSAVSEHDRDGDSVPNWVPFVGALRATPERLMHPACFVAIREFDAFVALVEHSRRQQAAIFRLVDADCQEQPLAHSSARLIPGVEEDSAAALLERLDELDGK